MTASTPRSRAAKTQPLPAFDSVGAVRTWLASMTPRPRLRAARDTASMAVTDRLPCFGGDEVR